MLKFPDAIHHLHYYITLPEFGKHRIIEVALDGEAKQVLELLRTVSPGVALPAT